MRSVTPAALAIGLLAALPRVGAATEVSDAPGARVTIPDGVPAIPELTEAVVRDYAAQDRYGGAPFRANGKAFADGARGLGIYVLWLTTQRAVVDQADRIVDELEAKGRRPEASDAKGDVRVEERLASIQVEYATPKNGTRTLLRAVAFVDREQMVHEVTVECVMREDALADVRPVCEAAIASLEVTLPEAQRAPIGSPAAGSAEPTSGAATPEPTGAAAAEPSSGPLVVTTEPPPSGSRRWWLIGGGALVVLAIAVAVRRRKRR